METNQEKIGVRIDKYLWAIRVFKTRTIAAEFIAKGKVKNTLKQAVKASYKVKVNDEFTIEINKDFFRVIRVKDFLEKRLGAELVKPFFEELTPLQEKKERLPSVFMESSHKNEKSKGRPTKKKRRDLGNIGYF